MAASICVLGDGFMIHDAGGNSQLELRCMNKSSPGLIKLNCSDSTSSLHKCQVTNLETVPRDCGCNQESFRIHATIECHKGTAMTA